MAQNQKRGRNQRRRSNSGNVNRAMDSTGPDVKIRGTAMQIHDKYQALARDAASAGDRVRAESLLQHAEHYFRVMKAMQPQQAPQNDPAEEPQPSVDSDSDDGGKKKKSAKSSRDDQSDNDQKSSDTEDQNDQSADSDDDEDKPRRTRRKRPTRKAASADDDNSEDGSEDDNKKSDQVAEVAAE